MMMIVMMIRTTRFDRKTHACACQRTLPSAFHDDGVEETTRSDTKNCTCVCACIFFANVGNQLEEKKDR
jgi:hypothetical protein